MEKIKWHAKNLFKLIKDKLKEKEIFFFGEVHGTKEIPLILSLFFEFIDYPYNLALEIPSDYQERINNYLKSGDENVVYNCLFFKNSEESDGRNSQEYINLIKKIYLLNKNKINKIKILCVDISLDTMISSQNERESIIAGNLLKAAKFKKLFVVIGNVHAYKNIFTYENNNIYTVAYLLRKEKVLSISLLPTKGEFYNLGLRQMKSYKPQYKEGYDLVYDLGRVTPCSFRK